MGLRTLTFEILNRSSHTFSIFQFNEGLQDFCLEEDKGDNVGLGNSINALWHGTYLHSVRSTVRIIWLIL